MSSQSGCRSALILRASAALECVGVWSHVVALAIPIKLHNTHATRVYPCSQLPVDLATADKRVLLAVVFNRGEWPL